MAEMVKVPIETLTRVDPRNWNHVFGGPRSPMGRGSFGGHLLTCCKI